MDQTVRNAIVEKMGNLQLANTELGAVNNQLVTLCNSQQVDIERLKEVVAGLTKENGELREAAAKAPKLTADEPGYIDPYAVNGEARH